MTDSDPIASFFFAFFHFFSVVTTWLSSGCAPAAAPESQVPNAQVLRLARTRPPRKARAMGL